MFYCISILEKIYFHICHFLLKFQIKFIPGWHCKSWSVHREILAAVLMHSPVMVDWGSNLIGCRQSLIVVRNLLHSLRVWSWCNDFWTAVMYAIMYWYVCVMPDSVLLNRVSTGSNQHANFPSLRANYWRYLTILCSLEYDTPLSIMINSSGCLTLPMLQLLSSQAQSRNDFWKPSKPCHVGIH